MQTMLRRFFLVVFMLAVLSACGEFFKTEKPHSWEGAISFILSPLISTAHAARNICLSKCTSTKCAHLIVHTNSTTSETVCMTNADVKYKFDFSKDPNVYYNGKMIEIKIVDPNDELNNRLYVEVVDEESPITIKDMSVPESLLATAIKGQVLQAMDLNVPDLRGNYEEAVTNMTIERLNSAFGFLAGYYANLLNDLENTVEVRKAIELANILEPTFLGVLMSKYQESEIESDIYSDVKTLCNDENTNLSGEDNLQNSNRPNCYLLTSSIASGSPQVWSPLSELPAGCVFNPATTISLCTDPGTGLNSLEPLPSQPAALANYTRASTHLAATYNNNNCYTDAQRGGGMVVVDTSIQLMFNAEGVMIVNLAHNSFYALKAYSTCLNDPTAYPSCGAFAATPGIKELQLSMVQNDFCYY